MSELKKINIKKIARHKEAIFGEILKINRERLKLSESELAEKIYVTEDDIISWESGRQHPTDYDKFLLSSIFFIPFEFLLSNFNEDIEKSFAFRATSLAKNFPKPYMYIFASKAKSVKDFFDLVNQNLSDNTEFLSVKMKDYIFLTDEDIKYLSNIEYIDDKAKIILHRVSEKFHKYYDLDYGAKKELLKTLYNKLATIIYTPTPEGYNGISFISEDDRDFYIFINSQDHYCKQTFTLIHEIGHIIFYKVNNPRLIEDIINYFVNIILLPPNDMEELFKDFSVDTFDNSIDVFKYVSKEYEVSYKTIIYSLYHIGKLVNINSISEFIDGIMLKYFGVEDSAVERLSYRHNIHIYTYLAKLLNEGVIDVDYVKEMNNVAPFIE